jgi:hypothetical protein
MSLLPVIAVCPVAPVRVLREYCAVIREQALAAVNLITNAWRKLQCVRDNGTLYLAL